MWASGKAPTAKTSSPRSIPVGYSSSIRNDLSKPPTAARAIADAAGEQDWVAHRLDGKVTGVYADYHYVGTGDIGGAADEETVACWRPW